MPAAVRRFAIQSGDGFTSTPDITVEVKRAQRIAVDDLDRASYARFAGDFEGGDRRAKLDAHLGSEVAGDPDVAPAVRTVAGHVSIDQHIEAEPKRLAVWQTERRVGIEQADARVVVAEAQFGGAAEHSFRVDAQDAASLDGHPVRHGRAERGERNDVAFGDVVSPAPDVQLVAGTRGDVDAAAPWPRRGATRDG